MDTQLREAQAERALVMGTEQTAAHADITSPEMHRYLESAIAEVTRR